MQEKEEKIKNISETNRVKKQEVIEEEEPSKLKNFFAENLLAKIG
jgi:hypothetical protein